MRRYDNFTAAEDATQEALAAAAVAWPAKGLPTNPKGWLIRVALRRLTDLLRNDQAPSWRRASACSTARIHQLGLL